MKRLSFFVFLLIIVSYSYAQQWTDNLPTTKKSSELTLFDYQKAFNSYWDKYEVRGGFYYENGEKKKARGWKQFKRWEYYMESQIDPTTGKFPNTTAEAQVKKFYNGSLPKSSAGNWMPMGPNSSEGGYAGVGRINSIAFHHTDNNTYWVGTPGGGIWKTDNNGVTWTCLANNNAVLGVSDIVIPSDYQTSNTIYIATGDRDAWDNISVGVLKSTDGGLTWNSTGLSFLPSEQKMVNRLLIDPTNNNILIAATSAGVYKTTDAGANWTKLATKVFIDLEYQPGNFNRLYGSNESGDIYYSDGGTTWTSGVTTTAGYRTELAVSPNQPTWVYAIMAASDNSLYGIYKSTDSGTSYSNIFAGTTTNLLGWDADGHDAGGQGFYDLVLTANPADANMLFVGGVNKWKSTNGGTSWALSSHWNGSGTTAQIIHADHHEIKYRSDGSLFNCNDGGLYMSSDNGVTWVEKGEGIINSQIYKLSNATTSSTEIITGLQDNGSKLFANGTWSDVKGGDGMECLIDYSDINIQYATYVEGQIDRTTDHWSSSINISAKITGGQPVGAWVTPYIIDPNTASTIYAGYADVWKSTNRGDAWTKISTMATADKLRSMAIAPSNNQVLYVADRTKIWKTTNGGSAWADVRSNLPATGYITYIAIKANDPNTVWVTISGYTNGGVYESTNAGVAWTRISTGLPTIPCNAIVQNKLNTTTTELYVGTDFGVYFKNGANNWILFSNGLPNVKIGEIEIWYGADAKTSKLRAATYGRGLWESDLYYLSTNMSYTSCTTTQTNISDLGRNTINQQIIGIQIVTNGANSPLSATSFTFNTTGSTNALGDITNAKVFYTGTNSAFNSTLQFGNTVVSPNGTFIVNGTQELADGTNYFWLAYDVPASATLNNVLDAQCTSLTVGGTSRTLTATNPTGTRKIILIYCEAGANASNVAAWDRITNVTIGTINKTSTSESPAYADYTSFSTEANAGSTVNFTITTAGHDSTDKLLIWIDYNGDGDFDDSGENVYTSTESFSSPKSGSFVIPANTIAGAKRMRIRLNYPTGNTTPCGYSLYGEVEDYTINVLAPEINVKQATDIADAGIYNFGNIATGSNSGAITFTIENKGTASLSLSGTPKVAITGTNASDFTIVQSGLTSSISAGINQTFTISFAPGGTGLRTAAISIANNDADENPYNITLNGTGTAAATAEMNVKQNTTNIADAGSFSFGNVNMLSSSGILTFTIENTGDANLTLSGTPKILISGTHAADFAVVQTSTLSTVTAGSSTTFTINFTPSAFGTRIANISIANNDADENPYNFDITGMGVKLDQSITFVTLPAKTYGDVNFNLTATSTSGLAVTYTSSNTAVATVSGSTVHIVGQGNTIITATQTGNANYNPAPEQTQQLNVAKATLTVTAEGKSKVYGTTNPTFTVLYDGWKNGDNTSVITTPVSINSSATQFTQVGAYNIVPNGAAANNYDFAYVNGILNITKATLTVTADNQTKIQGTTNPTLTFTYSGWVNGQETIDTPPAISTTVNTATTVGTYNGSITVSGGLDNNYLFNYVPGNFIVTAAATAEMNVKQNTTNIADAGSFSFGNVNMLSSSGILTFTIENTGDANLTLSGTPKILISGTHAADFAVVQTSTLSTVTAGSSTTFTINFTPSAFGTRIANISIANNDADENPYNFDITGMGVKLDQSITFVTLPAKTYGDVNFNLTATSTSGLAVTYTSSNTAVATVSGSTVHIVGQGNTIITATQTGNANYNPAPEQTQQLNVAKATLTVTAEGKSKVYGTTNPTFTVLYDGWKNGDNTSVITTPVSINSSATQFTQVGAYNIVPNGAAANNYDFAYVNGILNITKATLTVTADNQTKIQGTTNPTLTFTYSGWVNGQETIDTPPAISTTVNTATTVGTYNGSITVSGGLDNNYLFNYVPGNFIVTSSVVTITWTGTAWTPQAPTSTDDAIINGNYTIATGFECKNLTINQGKILQISPLTTVIVNENITNMGTIICKSNPATNDASGALLNRGEITGTGIYKAERNLKENSVQHYVGAPMMNVPYTIFAGNYYLRQLTSAATWTTVTSNLNNMQGYSVVFGRANKMLYFQNATGTAPFTTGNQVINTWNGQNLVANPYPTPIDWNAANGWSKTNISATIYFRNGNRLATWNGEVGVNGGTRYIPAMQGFVVASNGYSALEINNNAKVTNAQANQIFWKNSVNNIVRLNVEGGKYQGDEMVIVFNSDATDNYDMTHDGLKLFDEEENKYANIYTISNDNKQLCINYLPQTEVMDLYFNANETAVYTISATEMNLDFTDNVYLEDLFTGEFTDLSQANYSFTYNLNDTENRFRLHFNKTNAVEKTDIETVNIYSYNSDIYINSSATDGKVSVYSITGVELINCDLRKVINTNLANGIYTVKVTTLHGTYTANVFINK